MNLSNSSVAGVKTKTFFKLTSYVVVFFSILTLSKTAGAPIVHAEAVNVNAPASATVLVKNKPAGISNTLTSGNAEIDQFILNSATRHGVDPKLVFYVIRQESNFKTVACSGKNAQGLMQMIPDTAKRFGVEDPYDPQQNIEGGVKYLRWLLNRFNGDVKLALAGYNAGEGAVKKCNNQVPDYKETKDYVQKITAAYGKTYHPVSTPEQAREEIGAIATE